ncbi:unnamed protein product, partial [marine sediment metagenome]
GSNVKIGSGTTFPGFSLPKGLADDIQKIIDEFGYWPSLGAFIREAALEKLRREKPGKVVPEPILTLEP